MKRIVASLLVLGIVCVGIVGCAQKTSTNTEKKVTGPGGETTTTQQETQKSGQNPPPSKP